MNVEARLRISRVLWMLSAFGGTHAGQHQILQAASGKRREVGMEVAGRVHERQCTGHLLCAPCAMWRGEAIGQMGEMARYSVRERRTQR